MPDGGLIPAIMVGLYGLVLIGCVLVQNWRRKR